MYKKIKIMNIQKRFTDKVCIVTGGSSGIGKATAMQFAREGAKVVILNRDVDEGVETIKEIQANGGNAIFIQTDIGKVSEVKAAVEKTLEQWQKIDILINNAAKMTYKPITELTVEDWEEVMNVNLRSAFLFCKYCIPHMDGGIIINTSSVHAHQTTKNVAPYATSKGAIEAFTRAISLDYPAEKLRINCVAPGAVETPMLRDNPNIKDGTEKIEGAIGKPEDIAGIICFLASAEANFINGTTIVADGGRLAQL
jgi:glucose 1-dehydrogenase